jgi:hypothetical protein
MYYKFVPFSQNNYGYNEETSSIKKIKQIWNLFSSSKFLPFFAIYYIPDLKVLLNIFLLLRIMIDGQGRV